MRTVPVSTVVSPDSRLRAVGYMALAALFIPLLNTEVKYLGPFYPVVQILWFRYFGHLVVMLIVFAPRRGVSVLRSKSPWLQTIRSLLFCLTSFAVFYALQYVPIATTAAISFTAPMIVLALAPLLLGEKVSGVQVAAVIAGFAGALLVIQPGGQSFHPAAIVVMLSAVTSALTQILSRKLAGRDTPETSNTYLVVAGFIVTSFALPFYWQAPQSPLHLALLLSLGIVGGAGHYLVMRAFELAPAPFLAPFNYLQIVGAGALGYWFFTEAPNFWAWVGTATIVGSGIFVLIKTARIR